MIQFILELLEYLFLDIKYNNDLGIKTYTNLSQIGCTLANTIEEVFNSLPTNSKLNVTIAEATTGIFVEELPFTKTACEVVFFKGNHTDRGYL